MNSGHDDWPDKRYAWFVVGVLMLANVSSYVDRQILALLVSPIKRDLQLSDTRMGLLYGLSFAVFYTLLGFPIARLADRGNRKGIIAAGTAIWSVMTAACGLASTFTQLALARIGVGVGEAALGPPAISMIADYFRRNQLARAVSVYAVGIYLGSGLAYLIGGQVVQQWAATDDFVALPLLGLVRPWQFVFVLVGLPGLLIAALMLLIREPVRRVRPSPARAHDREVIAWVRTHRRAFTSHTFGYSFFSMVNLGTAAWLPSFLERAHGWSPGRIGVFMGGATMIFGVGGILAGGWLADRLLARGREDAKLLVGVIGSLGALASAIPLYLAGSDLAVILLLVPLNIFSAFPFGAAQAALQEMSPSPYRARITAGYLFVNSMVGLALGPSLVALATDYLFRSEAMVGYSILLVALLGHGAASTLLLGGRSAYARAVSGAAESDQATPER
ncbi:MAG: spinster family MFS transporter [Gemmatimonadota bacterium]